MDNIDRNWNSLREWENAQNMKTQENKTLIHFYWHLHIRGKNDYTWWNYEIEGWSCTTQ